MACTNKTAATLNRSAGGLWYTLYS